MKGLIVIASLLVVQGCTLDHLKNGYWLNENQDQYMTREEVLEEASALENSKEMDGPLTEEEKLRESNLIPDEVLLKDVPSLPKSLLSDDIPDNAPLEISLLSRNTPVKQQVNGRCSAYGLVATVENLINKNKKIDGLDLSESHLWSFYKVYSANAAISKLTQEKYRIGDEVDFPQATGKAKSTLRPHTYITKQAYIGDSKRSAVLGLMAGHPLYIAMKTPKQLLTCNKVVNGGLASSGGHALAVTSYYLSSDRKKVFLGLKNSWGPKCGDHGIQYFDMDLCKNTGFYCNIWEIYSVDTKGDPRLNPTSVSTEIPSHPTLKKVCKRVWYKFGARVCSYIEVK